MFIDFADGTNIEIQKYRLRNDRFVGEIYTEDGWVEFSLYKTSHSYYDDYWDRYDWYERWYY